MLRARKSRQNKPVKGNKHPGLYNNGKDLVLVPNCSYVVARFALPVGHVQALQALYPNKTINMAIKAYLLDNIQPQDVKEI